MGKNQKIHSLVQNTLIKLKKKNNWHKNLKIFLKNKKSD